MSIDIRPFSGDATDYFAVIGVAFGGHSPPEEVEMFMPLFEAERALGAYDDESCVGVAAIYSVDLTVPGTTLPTAAVTMVGVLPTHRRRGALTNLMQLQLANIHERGEPLAALWASEGSIYQRFGYGMSTVSATFEIERWRVAWRTPHAPRGSVRLVSSDEAASMVPAVHDRIAPTRPGFISRSAAFWRAEYFYDPEHRRDGASAAFHVVHERDGAADAYATYRIRQDWSARVPRSVLLLTEVQAIGPDATREIWEYLFGVDLIATIRARAQAPDLPLLLMLLDPRRLGLTLGDGMWLRVVDAAAALGARSYAGEDRLVLDLRDDICDWNAGRWALDASREGARVARTTDNADLALDAADLGTIYLGGHSVVELLAAGRGEERTAGAASRLDALLRVDRAPWCPIVF